MFAGSHAGAERAAIAYSILGTCALLDINPAEYLADLLPKLARGFFTRADLATQAPAAWKKAPTAAPPALTPLGDNHTSRASTMAYG